MKPIVIYRSMTGFTRKYAQWIAEELFCEARDVTDIKRGDLDDYDTVIYGGAMSPQGILGQEFLVRNRERLKGKNIYLFASGLSPVTPESVESIRSSIPQEVRELGPFFYMRGGYSSRNLGILSRSVMWMIRRRLRNREDLRIPEVMEILRQNPDLTDREYIYPLISRVRL